MSLLTSFQYSSKNSTRCRIISHISLILSNNLIQNEGKKRTILNDKEKKDVLPLGSKPERSGFPNQHNQKYNPKKKKQKLDFINQYKIPYPCSLKNNLSI